MFNNMKCYIILLVSIITISVASEHSVISARIESCRGCSLNRLPEVKKFIVDDVPQYENVEVKYISGAPPELVLLGEQDKELERLPLSSLSQQECNTLLQQKGFFRKQSNSEF